MDSVSQLILANRSLIVIVIAIAVIRGVLVPDFRYGLQSVLMIQVVFPFVLLAVLVVKADVNHHFGQGVGICILAIVLSQIVAIIHYSLVAGQEELVDPVTHSVFLGSFIAQLVLFILSVILYYLLKLKR